LRRDRDGFVIIIIIININIIIIIIIRYVIRNDCLCGVMVRVPGSGSRGPGFNSRRYQIFCKIVGLERGPLSLVRIVEELLERKVAAPA
jgi:hypothetical protein